jgi:hypothetical protein
MTRRWREMDSNFQYACAVNLDARRQPEDRFNFYPALQDMLLATRALGLGTTLTTRHIGYAKGPSCDCRGIHTREIHNRSPRREDKAGGPDTRKAGNQGKRGVPNHPKELVVLKARWISPRA